MFLGFCWAVRKLSGDWNVLEWNPNLDVEGTPDELVVTACRTLDEDTLKATVVAINAMYPYLRQPVPIPDFLSFTPCCYCC